MKKLIFIDIDGTLRDDNKNISILNKKALKKLENNGYSVVLASGRPVRKVLEVYSECELNASYIITTDGSQLYDVQNKNFIYYEKIDVSDILFLKEIIKKYRCSITFNSKDKSYKFDYQTVDSFINCSEISQVVICSDSFLDLVDIRK